MAANARRGICGPCPRRMAANALSGLQNDKTVGRCSHSAARQYALYSNPADKTVGRCSHSAARQYMLYSRSSPLLAITFLYHPKDFFLYRAAALFEYREKHQ